MDRHKVINVSLQFISFKDLEIIVKCEDNKKIIDEFCDNLPVVYPLKDRNPLPINLVYNKK